MVSPYNFYACNSPLIKMISVKEKHPVEIKDTGKPEEINNQGKTKEDLSICTSAPSAEHARATNEDEPCDDGRAGKVDED
jgi:hypothetical protein